MKAIVLFCLVSALCISTTNAAAAIATSATLYGLDFSTTDSGASSSLYPITLTATSGGAAYAYLSAPAVAAGTSSSSNTQPVLAAGTANAYTVAFKNNVGVPVNQVWTQSSNTGTSVVVGTILTIPVGPQVSLSVSGVPTVAGTNTDSAGSLQANAAAVSATAATCGSYYIDCAAGVLTVQLHTPAVANTVCTVTINQIPAVFGGLAYATTLPTGAQANIATAITANSNGASAPNYCGTTSSSGNTVYLFTSPLASTASTSDVNTAQAKLLAAIKAKTAFTGSARLLEESERVLATSYTLVNGYATALPTNAAGGVVAPSTTASASLAANATSQSRVVVIAGLFTTILAAVFGLAL